MRSVKTERCIRHIGCGGHKTYSWKEVMNISYGDKMWAGFKWINKNSPTDKGRISRQKEKNVQGSQIHNHMMYSETVSNFDWIV